MELADLRLELLVNILSAADKAHRAHTESMGLETVNCSLDYLWIVTQT